MHAVSMAPQPGGDSTHFLRFSLRSFSQKSHSLFLWVCLSLGTDSFLLALPFPCIREPHAVAGPAMQGDSTGMAQSQLRLWHKSRAISAFCRVEAGSEGSCSVADALPSLRHAVEDCGREEPTSHCILS